MTRKFPLLFGFHEVVLCKGFVAGVTVQAGRALVEEEAPGEWWVSGVNPGALADGGKSFSEAIQNFCGRFRKVLADYASDANEIRDFKASLESFFNSSDPETLAEWDEARAEMRKGGQTINDLVKDAKPKKPTIIVKQLNIVPKDNLRANSNAGMTSLAA